ncbi:MAG: hypothetical protein ABJN84_17830 [Flavobacteriaceae bacterium]
MPDGAEIENSASMQYWMKNPATDSFLKFENGIQVESLGGFLDLIHLSNRVINPPQKVNGVSLGLNLPNTIGPTAPKLQANAGAKPIGYGRDENGKYGPIFPNIPNNNQWY